MLYRVRFRKPVCGLPYRGFESHPLRLFYADFLAFSQEKKDSPRHCWAMTARRCIQFDLPESLPVRPIVPSKMKVPADQKVRKDLSYEEVSQWPADHGKSA